MQIIDLNYFTKRLSSWLAPEVLLQAIGRIEDNREQAIQPSMIAVTSPNLSIARDGGLMQLIESFVKDFRIPAEILELLKQFNQNLPTDILDELSNYKFSGSVERPTIDLGLPADQNPIVVVKERDVFVDILTQPLQGLGGMVSSCGLTWMSLFDNDVRSVFLQQTAADPFGTWLDATVASNLGFPSIASPENEALKNLSMNNGYRLITMVGWDEANPSFIEACRFGAKTQADGTREPINKERLYRNAKN